MSYEDNLWEIGPQSARQHMFNVSRELLAKAPCQHSVVMLSVAGAEALVCESCCVHTHSTAVAHGEMDGEDEGIKSLSLYIHTLQSQHMCQDTL